MTAFQFFKGSVEIEVNGVFVQVPVDLADQPGDLSDLRVCDSDGFEGSSSCAEVYKLQEPISYILLNSGHMSASGLHTVRNFDTPSNHLVRSFRPLRMGSMPIIRR